MFASINQFLQNYPIILLMLAGGLVVAAWYFARQSRQMREDIKLMLLTLDKIAPSVTKYDQSKEQVNEKLETIERQYSDLKQYIDTQVEVLK